MQSHRDSNLKTQWLVGHMTGPNYIYNIPPSPFGVAQGKLKRNMKPKYKTVSINKTKKGNFLVFFLITKR